jgi:hypothetical protein
MWIILSRQNDSQQLSYCPFSCPASPSSSKISIYPQFHPTQLPQTPLLNVVTIISLPPEEQETSLHTIHNLLVTHTVQQDFNMCFQFVPVYEACGHRYDAAAELQRCPKFCAVPKEELVTQQTTQMCPDCEGDHVPDYSTGEYFKV